MGMLEGREPTAVNDFVRESYRLRHDDYTFYRAWDAGNVVCTMHPRQFDEILADPSIRSLVGGQVPVNKLMGAKVFTDPSMEETGYKFYVLASAS